MEFLEWFFVKDIPMSWAMLFSYFFTMGALSYFYWQKCKEAALWNKKAMSYKDDNKKLTFTLSTMKSKKPHTTRAIRT